MNARAITTLARNSVAEALRDRILYGLLLFALGLILLSSVISSLTLGHQVRIVTDLCLSAISWSGSLMAVLLGVTSVSRELERRTAYPVLAKPIGRADYLLGKYAGVLATVYLNVSLMFVAATVMIAVYSYERAFQYPVAEYLAVVLLLLIKFAVVAAFAVTFSAFTSSTVALIASFGLLIAGGFTGELRFFLGKSEEAVVRGLGEALYYVVPDLASMEGLSRLLHGEGVAAGPSAWAATYGALYAALLLLGASMGFRRRDLA